MLLCGEYDATNVVEAGENMVLLYFSPRSLFTGYTNEPLWESPYLNTTVWEANKPQDTALIKSFLLRKMKNKNALENARSFVE